MLVRLAACSIVLFFFHQCLTAADISTRVVDSAGQPVAGATVAGSCEEGRGLRRRQQLFVVKSGADGTVSGTYDEPAFRCNVSIGVFASGYENGSYNEFRPVYVLKKSAYAEELRHIAALPDDPSKAAALRNVLTSDVMRPLEHIALER